MDRFDFYIRALKAGASHNKNWVISMLSLIQEAPDDWKKDPYPYRIIQTPTGFFFVDPESNMQLTSLEGYPKGEPPFKFKQHIDITPEDVPNLKTPIRTSVGNLFFNFTVMLYAFDTKFDYMDGEIDIGKFENTLAKRLSDESITVDEYIRFVDAIQYLTNFTQLCVWAATEKTMTPPPGIVEYKEKLLKETEGRHHDPAVIADIDAKLVAFDAEYLKGDPGEAFLISKKSRNIVRRKLMLMHGAETGLSEEVGVVLVKNSLTQGWQIDQIKPLIDSLRAGSFNRGAQTQLGGESVKWLYRASSNIAITMPDCGTKIGRNLTVAEDNFDRLVGFSVITPEGPVMVKDNEDAGKYLGKTLMVRSPMFCKLDKTDFCLTCVGRNLAQNPTAIPLAVAEVGSAFLNLFMKKMHGTALTLQAMDYKTAIT